jgi:hypothetical protein
MPISLKGRKGIEMADFLTEADCALNMNSATLAGKVVKMEELKGKAVGISFIVQLLTATAVNVVRIIAWLRGEPLGERRRPPGHFALLSLTLLSRQTVLC